MIELIEDVKINEGFSRLPYIDVLRKQHPEAYGISKEDMATIEKHFNKLKITFGYGFTFITKEEAQVVLKMRLQKHRKALLYKLSWLKHQPKEVIDILTEISYQLGINGLLKFKKTLNYIKNYNYKKAAVEMLDSKWAKKDSPKRAKELSNIIKNINVDYCG